MAYNKSLLLLGLLLAAFMIISEVAARDLVETSNANNEAKGTEDAKYGGYPGGGGGYPGGGGYHGGGGYPGGGYPGGGGGRYCRFGCCGRRDYRGYCLRCCNHANEAINNAQIEAKPHN